MTELKCSVETCNYNQDHLCCKGDIQVGGKQASRIEETSCVSYVPRKNGSCTNSMTQPSKMVGIDCEAWKCMYNEGCKCVAAKVDIKECPTCNRHDTECATFSVK